MAPSIAIKSTATRVDRRVVRERAEILDRAQLMERFCGDTELVAAVADEFFAQAETLLAGIRTAIDDEDVGALVRHAHTLKGAVGNFASRSALVAALALEMAGYGDDLEAATTALGLLESRLAELRPALAALCCRP
ncbi:MAG: Hpt domain-containing protein [Planctomycetota bacterium]|jgi:HPt (histidine-containing phosphotransfer) domain-containing protein